MPKVIFTIFHKLCKTTRKTFKNKFTTTEANLFRQYVKLMLNITRFVLTFQKHQQGNTCKGINKATHVKAISSKTILKPKKKKKHELFEVSLRTKLYLYVSAQSLLRP